MIEKTRIEILQNQEAHIQKYVTLTEKHLAEWKEQLTAKKAELRDEILQSWGLAYEEPLIRTEEFVQHAPYPPQVTWDETLYVDEVDYAEQSVCVVEKEWGVTIGFSWTPLDIVLRMKRTD